MIWPWDRYYFFFTPFFNVDHLVLNQKFEKFLTQNKIKYKIILQEIESDPFYYIVDKKHINYILLVFGDNFRKEIYQQTFGEVVRFLAI